MVDVAHDLDVPGLRWSSQISVATWFLAAIAAGAIIYYGWPKRTPAAPIPAAPRDPQTYNAPGLRRMTIAIPTQQWAA